MYKSAAQLLYGPVLVSECASIDEPVPAADRLPQPGVLAGHHVHPGLHLTALHCSSLYQQVSPAELAQFIAELRSSNTLLQISDEVNILFY